MIFTGFWSRRRGSNSRPQSRTLRATSCATPRFFSFLSIFVSGQTCGQATYFERFVEKYTAQIVSVVKGFRGSKKSTKESPCGCPEPYARPVSLSLNFLSSEENILSFTITTLALDKIFSVSHAIRTHNGVFSSILSIVGKEKGRLKKRPFSGAADRT